MIKKKIDASATTPSSWACWTSTRHVWKKNTEIWCAREIIVSVGHKQKFVFYVACTIAKEDNSISWKIQTIYRPSEHALNLPYHKPALMDQLSSTLKQSVISTEAELWLQKMSILALYPMWLLQTSFSIKIAEA